MFLNGSVGEVARERERVSSRVVREDLSNSENLIRHIICSQLLSAVQAGIHDALPFDSSKRFFVQIIFAELECYIYYYLALLTLQANME